MMNELIFREIKLNLDLKSCYVDEEEVKLTKSEFNLLEALIRGKNKIYTRREILNLVGKPNISLSAVDTALSNLRKKLGTASRYLITRFGFGYGLVDYKL